MEPEKICAECGDNLSRRSREKRSDGQYMCVRCVVRGRERERRRETLRTASAKVAVGVLIAIAALLILAVMLYLFGDIAAPGKTMSIGNADLIFPGGREPMRRRRLASRSKRSNRMGAACWPS